MVRLQLLYDGIFVADMRTFLPDGPSEPYSAVSKSLLIETGKEKILVDSGIGDIPKEPRYDYLRSMITIKRPAGYGIVSQLGKRGIRPRDITTVINTHLHAAHCGHDDLFTNARICVSKDEYKFFDSLERDDPKKGVYVPSNFENLKNVEEISGEQVVAENVRVIPTPGHTLGHQSVVVQTETNRIVYCADVAPLKVNLQNHIAMNGYDRPLILDQMQSLLKIKNAKWIFCHDRDQLTMRQAYVPRKHAA